MLPGDRAIQFDCFVEDVRQRVFDAFHFVCIGLVGKNRRVDVAIAKVSKCRDIEIVFLAHFLDEADNFHEPTARDRDVLKNGRWSNSCQGRECRPARRCKPIGMRFVFCLLHRYRAVFLGNGSHGLALLFHHGLSTVGLHENYSGSFCG